MLSFTVEIDWVLFSLVGALGMVLAGLYALALNTPWGLALCKRRTHWTVIGGHVLMALTMCLVSPAMAGLWLVWSVVHGLPLVIRSEVQRWRDEGAWEETVTAAIRGLMKGRRSGVVYEAGDDGGAGNGHGDDGAGVSGSG